ncbi:DEAD/DEAH box helicase [Gemmatimonas sp.]|uniref:DEAD/DEAH box helicase n=1 Tax=Gemmatimonas sp. TaxID=1962908 RepID=UPI00286D9546|nr:DEAD/DEAH box helicase [Gemmatimonas sp.]
MKQPDERDVAARNSERDVSETGFAALGLDPRIASALAALGYEEPTPVQRAAIPPLLEGRDVLAQAATGTGKTAAFALPLLSRVNTSAKGAERTSALILVPTRELAMQVAEAVHRYGKPMGVSALAVYGGSSMEMQVRALKRGVDVVIATPGRALDHIRRHTLQMTSLKTVVLDEADEMLDMGFAEDLEAILEATPKSRQTALFSATLPPRIASIAKRQLRDPVLVTIDREIVPDGEAARVRQVAYIVPRAHKMTALARVLDIEQPTSAIVFCRTRTEVDELSETLMARGLRADALHGGLSQDQRDRVMTKFRTKKTDLLIATDVAARGLDVKHVSHVVNFDVPADAESYVHRIGRTGRAGREGVAITLAEPREHRLLRNIERMTSQRIEIAQVPTVDDLRAHRLELVRTTLRETIMEGGLDKFRGIVESLAGEFDVMDIAAAAVKLFDANDETDEPDIPAVQPRSDDRGSRDSSRGRDGARDSAREGGRPSRSGEEEAPRGAKAAKRSKPEWSVARLWVGAGRKLKMRPGDLVGAIANEVGIDASVIGAIQIADGYSTVEVPEEIAEDIITALRNTTIKGKKVLVRRDRMR